MCVIVYQTYPLSDVENVMKWPFTFGLTTERRTTRYREVMGAVMEVCSRYSLHDPETDSYYGLKVDLNARGTLTERVRLVRAGGYLTEVDIWCEGDNRRVSVYCVNAYVEAQIGIALRMAGLLEPRRGFPPIVFTHSE